MAKYGGVLLMYQARFPQWFRILTKYFPDIPIISRG